MKKKFAWIGFFGFLIFAQNISAQERFIDVRQMMADELTSVKTSVANQNWMGAKESLQEAKTIWLNEVKPLVVEGVKTNEQFQEYFNRIGEVEKGLDGLDLLLAGHKVQEIDSKVNAIIWAISHQPRGFDVPQARYSTWDWIFGLSIGIGFCIFAFYFGLYLRRSYYHRYKKQGE
jgi:hypothetical protein